MWIDTTISLPIQEGKYKCLVIHDDFGNLQEVEDQLFNGRDWDLYESNCQGVRYWWADEEQYNIVSTHLYNELEVYQGQLEIESKNFGGL